MGALGRSKFITLLLWFGAFLNFFPHAITRPFSFDVFFEIRVQDRGHDGRITVRVRWCLASQLCNLLVIR